MRPLPPFSWCSTLLLATLLGPAAAAEDAEVLPDASVRLSAARYAPTFADLHWEGWIGAGVGVMRVRDTTAYLDGDIETILGATHRSFEANQANYHIELGVRHRLPWGEGGAFLHHVSRHSVDRAKDPPIDWNILGARTGRSFRLGRLPASVGASLGWVMQASTVDYRWEARGRAESVLLQRPWGDLYGSADARMMKTAPSGLLQRRAFVDVALEAGARVRRKSHVIEAFAAFGRRNDALLLASGARSRAVLGVRFGFAGGDPPAGPIAPPSSSPWCSVR